MPIYTFTLPASSAGLDYTIADSTGATATTGTLGAADSAQGPVTATATLDADTYTLTATDARLFKHFTAPGILDVSASIAAAIPAPAAPTDGHHVAWSETLGEWVAVEPSGAVLLTSAINTTGVVTTCSTTGGLGTAVAVPGTAIIVPDSGGLSVGISWWGYWQQTVAADGQALLALYETTTSPTQIRSSYNRLPNSTAVPVTYFDTPVHFHDIGVVTTTRTFQLYVQLWTAAAVSATARLMNLAASPTGIRAATGL